MSHQMMCCLSSCRHLRGCRHLLRTDTASGCGLCHNSATYRRISHPTMRSLTLRKLKHSAALSGCNMHLSNVPANSISFVDSQFKSKYLIANNIDLTLHAKLPIDISFSHLSRVNVALCNNATALLSAEAIQNTHLFSNISSSLPVTTTSLPGIRYFHTGSVLLKEESKVEQTVKALKEKVTEDAARAPEGPHPETLSSSTTAELAPVKKTIMQKVVHEVKHYYHGFRLLFIDIRICARLLVEVLRGRGLTRRERRQLVRTTADLFRLVPFLVFIIVPFMEFLLPIAVKLFPNMLPSTFSEATKEQEKYRKRLKVKLEMAKFLQATIEETAVQGRAKDGDTSMVEEFSAFMKKIRTSGAQATTDELKKFSKLFEDEITLDNLTRGQLQALCRVLELQTLGTDYFLRFQLRMKLRQLKADDKMIEKEGVDSLTIWELQAACRARGMRALGLAENRLKSQLQQWLDLHLNENIPTSLLLLSRALFLPETLSPADQLQATLSSLPEATEDEARLRAAELAGEQVDNKTKLELIKQEDEAIKHDRAEELAEAERDAQIEQAKREELEAMEPVVQLIDVNLTQEHVFDVSMATDDTKLVDEFQEMKEEETISVRELEEIEAALEEIAEQKKLNIEKEELEELKEEFQEYKEDVEELKEVIIASGGKDNLRESKAAKRLATRVDRLINQLDDRIDALHREKDLIQEEIEVTEVRIRRSEELRSDEGKRDAILSDIQQKKGNIISINEMLLGLRRLQKIPNDARLQRIVEVLDEDKDGIIDVDHAHKVIELLGTEHVKLSSNQIGDVMELVKREVEIEEEEKLKERQEKEQVQEQQQQEMDMKEEQETRS